MLQGRGGVRFLDFRGGEGPFSGFQGRGGGTFQPRLGAGWELGECTGRVWGNAPGRLALPAL